MIDIALGIFIGGLALIGVVLVAYRVSEYLSNRETVEKQRWLTLEKRMENAERNNTYAANRLQEIVQRLKKLEDTRGES